MLPPPTSPFRRESIDPLIDFKWCRRSELNTRPHPYQGCALPLSYGGVWLGLLDGSLPGNHFSPELANWSSFVRVLWCQGGYTWVFKYNINCWPKSPLIRYIDMSTKSQFCTITMSKSEKPLEGKVQREARLLRENLKKRKAQARLRTAAVKKKIKVKKNI